MPGTPYVAQAGAHQALEWIGGSTVEVLLDAGSTQGQVTVLRSELEEGDASPWHVHAREDEMFLLLDGAAVLHVGEDRHELSAGGVVFLPRDIPHAYRIVSQTASMLTLCTPAGLEGFFRAAGHDRATPKPEGWAIAPPVLAEAMAAHGGRILGPPPAA